MTKTLPQWFRQDIISSKARCRLKEIKINTVCEEAHCPNFSACLEKNRLTVMILGDTCTRSCAFCAIKKSPDKVLPLDTEEPLRVAKEIRRLGIKYIVLTSVTRDDLPDGGAQIYERTIKLIKHYCSGIIIEVLIPDFKGSEAALKTVIDSGPQVLAHNIETVRRLYPVVRPGADYDISLRLLSSVKKHSSGLLSKSSIMLGMGETPSELFTAMEDLRVAGCDIITFGQYLAPDKEHYQVKEFISPQEFESLKEKAIKMGFRACLSGPLVRSSYQAEEIYGQLVRT